MKTRKEILQIILNEFNGIYDTTIRPYFYHFSICSAIITCNNQLITTKEYDSIHKFIMNNKPTVKFLFFGKHVKFARHKNFTKNEGYWWTLDKEGDEQRILFLEHLIKLEK